MTRRSTLFALGAAVLTWAVSGLPATAQDKHAGHGGTKPGTQSSGRDHHPMMGRMMAGMSAAEKKHMHAHMAQMSAGERKMMMDRMMRMSPAQRRKMAQQMMKRSHGGAHSGGAKSKTSGGAGHNKAPKHGGHGEH